MIYKNARLGENCLVQDNVTVGMPSRDFLREDEGTWPETVIGKDSILRSGTIIYCNTRIGKEFQTGHNLMVREKTVIGDNVIIGTNAVIEDNVIIGNNCRIQSLAFIPGRVVIEDDVFIGPNVVFINDPHPMHCPKYEECVGGATVKKLVRIGANCTILPGITIGENSLVAAGSVVVDDVPPGTVVAGNPAKVIRKINELKCRLGYFERPYVWEPYASYEREQNEKK